MNWFSRRLAEPSTRMGGLIIAGALTHILTAPPITTADWITTLFGVVAGVFGVATPEKGSVDASPEHLH